MSQNFTRVSMARDNTTKMLSISAKSNSTSENKGKTLRLFRLSKRKFFLVPAFIITAVCASSMFLCTVIPSVSMTNFLPFFWTPRYKFPKCWLCDHKVHLVKLHYYNLRCIYLRPIEEKKAYIKGNILKLKIKKINENEIIRQMACVGYVIIILIILCSFCLFSS